MDKIKRLIKKLRDTGFYHIFGSNVINKILGLISSFLIVRLVSKADFGAYSYALNLLSFFLILAGLGMRSGVLQLCSENAKKPEKAKEIFNYGFLMGNYFNVILGIAILIFALTCKLPIEHSNTILAFLAFIPLAEGIVELQKIKFRSSLENRKFSYTNTISAFLVVLLSIIGAYFFNINGIIIGRYLAAIITISIVIIYWKGSVPLKKHSLDGENKKALFKISLISMCNNGLSQMLFLIDVFLIGVLLKNPDLVADYKIATLIPTALLFIPACISIYIYPYFSMNKDNSTWVGKNAKKVIVLLGGFNLIVTVVLIAVAPFVIKTIFGEQYLTVVTIFRVLMISYFFNGTFRGILGDLLVTQRKLTFNFVVTLVGGLLNIVLNILFINYFGHVGAAYTTLIITIITSTVAVIYFTFIIKRAEK